MRQLKTTNYTNCTNWLRRSWRVLLLLAIFTFQLSIVNSVKAQQENAAFYIYQNDGHFDGFFYDEVLKISYSVLDTLGIEHDEIVSQEIVTADSTYRIMLTAIDSVGFVQPEMKMAEGLRDMLADEGSGSLKDYVISSDMDLLTVTFRNDLPIALRPVAGQVLVDITPNTGFGGRVRELRSEGGNLVAYCDPLQSIRDIFQQFIMVEEMEHDKQGNLVRRRVSGRPEYNVGRFPKPLKAEAEPDFDVSFFSWAVNGHIPIYTDSSEDFNASLDVGISVASKLKGTINIPTFGPFYIGLTLQQDNDLSVGVTIDGKLKDVFDITKSIPTAIYVPSMVPVFEVNMIPKLFLRGDIHAKLGMDLFHGRNRTWYKLEFQDDWLPTFSLGQAQLPEIDAPITNQYDRDVYFEINGFAQAGVKFPLTFGFNKYLASIVSGDIGVTAYVGPKVSAQFRVSFADMYRDGANVYNAIKDTKAALNLLVADVEAQAKVKSFWSSERKVTLYDASFSLMPDMEMYLFPSFELSVDVEKYSAKSGKLIAGITPSRSLFFPMQVGLGLYRDGELLESYYGAMDEKDNRMFYYGDEKTWKDSQTGTITKTVRAGEYEVKPLLRFEIAGVGEITLPASPSTTINVPGGFIYVDKQTKDTPMNFDPEGGTKSFPFKSNCTDLKASYENDTPWLKAEVNQEECKLTAEPYHLWGGRGAYVHLSGKYSDGTFPEATIENTNCQTVSQKGDGSAFSTIKLPGMWQSVPFNYLRSGDVVTCSGHKEYEGDSSIADDEYDFSIRVDLGGRAEGEFRVLGDLSQKHGDIYTQTETKGKFSNAIVSGNTISFYDASIEEYSVTTKTIKWIGISEWEVINTETDTTIPSRLTIYFGE